MSQPNSLLVVVGCTDRRSHPWRWITLFVDHRAVPLVDEFGEKWFGFLGTDKRVRPKKQGSSYSGGAVPGVHALDGERMYAFYCPTCRRDLQMRESTLGRAVDGLTPLAENGRVLLDLSSLPF